MNSILARCRLPALVLGLALAGGCADDDGPTDPGTDLPADLVDRIEALFPEGSTRDMAFDQVEAILDQASEDLLLDFIVFGSTELEAGRLLDPAGGDPPTSEGGLADLFEAVADQAGLEAPPVSEAALGEGAVMFVDEDGRTVVTRSGFGGVDFPAGALTERTLVILERLPEEGEPGDGPLPTDLDQYPIFYQVTTFPEVGELAADAVAGLCVVDPPDPFAPSPEVAARLRLAHPDPDDPADIEFLPLRDAPFVDCTGATTEGLGLASPGRLGGAIAAFSPIAGVDPLSGGPAPLVVTLDIPETVPNTPGSTITGTVEFADPEGDIVLAIVEAVSGPLDGFDVEPDVRGRTTGTFEFTIAACPEGEDPCATGEIQATITLQDAQQNLSEPFPFSYTAVAP
ncbi:MAG TPA: hypothetical protein VFG78_03305 [Gemmatimonadota bacterium]|nr:hypothetical protein [Gemmatimonadota bacterium]